MKSSARRFKRAFWRARRISHDQLAEGASCGLLRIARLMRLQAPRARQRRRLRPDASEQQATAVPANVLDRNFEAEAPNCKWIADSTYVWAAEGSHRKASTICA
jgi:putative transposase